MFVIAEAGVNHNGDLNQALKMVEAAAETGADCIKFQAFNSERLVAQGTKAADYQTRNTGEADQLELLRSLALSNDAFQRIAEHCELCGIEFLATPFDVDMAELLFNLGMKRIKIASGELTNDPALKRFASFKLPIVLSTGMASDEEVDHAVGVLRTSVAGDLTVLQCTSIYPAPAELANLNAMVAMGKRFEIPYGYSDHTLGDEVALAAIALGAGVIEKHMTLDKNQPGPDHVASLEPVEFSNMVARIRNVSSSLGMAEKRPGVEELETAALVRRSWHAARDLKTGTMLSEDDVVLMRPCTGLPPSVHLIGRRIVSDIAAHAPITSATLASE